LVNLRNTGLGGWKSFSVDEEVKRHVLGKVDLFADASLELLKGVVVGTQELTFGESFDF